MTIRIDHNAEEGAKDFLDRIDERYDAGVTLMREVQVETLRRLQVRSPIGEGVYSASHDLTVDKPSTLKAGKPGEEPKRQAEGKARTEKDVTPRRLKLLKAIRSFVTNNLPYTGPIEHGHSKQAARGVYRLVELEAQRLWNRESRKLSNKRG